MTPIEVLLSLGLHDSVIARRLQVSAVTVCRWRTKASTPKDHYQVVAVAYLSEIKKQIDDVTLALAFSRGKKVA